MWRIPNGTIVDSMELHLDEEQVLQSPEAVHARVIDFDISQNHLDTILDRLDLDIVVGCHLKNEPLQCTQWPAEALQIRFNGMVFHLDRYTAPDGALAHRVCRVKGLCRPTRNRLEVFLTSARSTAHYADCALSVSSTLLPL